MAPPTKEHTIHAMPPGYQSRRPPWRDVERYRRPRREPSILPPTPGIPIFSLLKKLWFPILLLPMMVLMMARLKNVASLRPPLLAPSPTPTPGASRSQPTLAPTPTQREDDGSTRTQGENGCVIGGCSGEICAEEEMFSTCIFRPEAICYKDATCERRTDGGCGWTQTPELTTCLEQYQSH